MSVINTNYLSMVAQSNLSKSQGSLGTAIERLSSGLRINSAKDDAAGQAIANRMTSQIKGLQQAQRNANDGISAAQTAEGALNQVNDNLQRIRELTVQAANGTNSAEDLDSIQNEITQRLDEINRISEETTFNGTKVLSEDKDLAIQVGAKDGEIIKVGLKKIDVSSLNLEGFNVNEAGEVANTAATADNLTLSGFTKASTASANGSYAWSKTETVNNTAATIGDVLAKAADGDTVTAATTTNGTGTAATGGTYIYDAASDSFSFDAADVTNENTVSYLTQGMSAGDMKEATVTIGGKAQAIKFDDQGNIFAADDNAVLYLDSTGNLTKNNAGTPPAATLENLAASMTIGAGTSTTNPNATFVDGDGAGTAATQTFSFGALAAGESIEFDGRTLTAAGAMTANDVAQAFANQFNNGSDASVGTAGAAGSYTMAGTASGNWSADASGTDTVFTFSSDAAGQAQMSAQVTRLGAATEGSITVGGTTLTADDAANGFDITGAKISASNLSGQLAANDTIEIAYGTDPDVTYTFQAANNIEVGGVQQFAQADDSIAAATTTVTTTTYYEHDNGNITDDAGRQAFTDKDGKLTLDAVSRGDATENPLNVLDEALKTVDSLRSDLGAIQNRFESAIDNLNTTATNLSAARSRIEDADYATEVSNMTRAQILQQAGTSVLAQANQIPQGVLSLLG